MSNENSGSKPASPAPTNRPRLAFMDTVEAAAILKTDRLTILKYVQEGRLRTFGGKPGNPFLRTEDVEKMAAELLPEQTGPALDPKTIHRNDPVRKIKLRMQQDAKWPEVDEAAMRAWAGELDLVSFNRMRQTAREAMERLQALITVLDEVEPVRRKQAGK
ncbi:MAG: hypothetical protein JWP00_4722 [Chloroflexi bacterium]|jgi:hypothetical protein|nr:hypothetical protein [Chloroflexota bacterium]